jgi:hypothetical protein
MPTTPLRPRQAVLPATALVLGALALSACGGNGTGAAATAASTPSTSTPSTTTGGGANRFAAYTSCLRQHGVTLPNFGGPRNGGTPPANPPSGAPPRNGGGRGGFFGNQTPAQSKAFQAAQTACASLRPQGGGFFGGRGGGQFNSQAFAAYRNCLTLHGVKLQQFRPGTRPAAPTAKLLAAQKACAALRPAGFDRRTPPSSNSGSGSG